VQTRRPLVRAGGHAGSVCEAGVTRHTKPLGRSLCIPARFERPESRPFPLSSQGRFRPLATIAGLSATAYDRNPALTAHSEDQPSKAGQGRGRAKTQRIFATNRAERNLSRLFRFQAV
jgi:hypothetical protein